MSFCKGEKGKYESGVDQGGPGWAGDKRSEEEMGPSIHFLGLWGNLDS